MEDQQPIKMPTSGKLLTLDGIDGVGKSTQIERITGWLEELGHEVMAVRDPGSTEVGRRLREILLESELNLNRRTEAMLFMASRCEMIETVIRPALSRGVLIVSDRFLLANVVYQSIGGAVSADELWQMGRWANQGLSPDLTILLDMPAEASMKRLDRAADRMELRGEAYLESVRQAFLSQLSHAGGQQVVVNAEQSPDEIFVEIKRIVENSLTDLGSSEK